MKTRNSNAKFQSSSTSYKDKHGIVLASKKLPLTAEDNLDDDESGGGNGKGKLGNYKLEKLRNVLTKGTFKANHFGKFLNQHGLDATAIKETELGKESVESAEKAVVEDIATKVKEDTQNAREITTAKEEAKGTDKKSLVDEKPAVRYGLFGENTSFADHQGSVIQASHGLNAEKRGLEALQGSGIAGSVTNSAAGIHGNALGVAKQQGAIGRHSILNNLAEKTANSAGSAPAAAEVRSQKPGARR